MFRSSVIVKVGYAWAGLMFLLGALNVFIAVTMSFQAWAWFITFGAIGAKVVAFLAQYWLLRSLVRRKLRSRCPTPRRSRTHRRWRVDRHRSR